MPKYALKVCCVHEERILPGGLLGVAQGCDLCGSYTRIWIVQLPDDPPETRRWEDVKISYNRLEERLAAKGPVMSFGADHSFPTSKEDHRGTILGGQREYREGRLWCAPCLEVLWDRTKQRRKTLVDRSTDA